MAAGCQLAAIFWLMKSGWTVEAYRWWLGRRGRAQFKPETDASQISVGCEAGGLDTLPAARAALARGDADLQGQ
jgi:hypothetical protein